MDILYNPYTPQSPQQPLFLSLKSRGGGASKYASSPRFLLSLFIFAAIPLINGLCKKVVNPLTLFAPHFH